MAIRLTDAPGDFAELMIEIDQVEVQTESGAWVNLSSESQMVSVLDLTNGAEIEIASAAQLEAGAYSAVAIHLGANSSLSVQSDGVMNQFDLETEEAIIIQIDEQVEAGGTTSVLLDFNVAESITLNEAGEPVLDPVVEEIEDEETGIQGHIEGGALAAIVLESADGSISGYTDANGNFLLRGMAAGEYSLSIETQGEAEIGLPGVGVSLGAGNSTTVQGVVVAEGSITQMGSISLQ